MQASNIDHSRRAWMRWMAAWAAVGLAGCGGGSDTATINDGSGGPSEPDAPTPGDSAPGLGVAGTEVTQAQRLETFAALEARIDELYDPATGRLPAAPMLSWLASQDAFQRVGYSATRDVYAIFNDGRPLIVATNLRADTEGVRDPAPASSTMQRMALRARATALPTEYEAGIPSAQLRFLDVWDYNEFDFPAPGVWCREGVVSFWDVNQMNIRLQQLGYRPITKSGGTVLDPALWVEGLKTVRGDGVFFWMTHGGVLDPAGQIIQGLMTATPAYQATVENTYADEFAEGTLIYYTAKLCVHPLGCRRGSEYTRLAITPQFIRKYAWSFDPHSLVFVNACASALAPMKQAFLDAGASLYLGWTRPVRLWAMLGAASDFFSLMLGLNENDGGGYAAPNLLLPRQRPYEWGAVMDLLHARTGPARYEDAEDGLVELEPTLNTSIPLGFLALRPSIFSMSFDESKSELTLIGGMFGTRGGTAAMGSDFECPDSVCAITYGRPDWRVSQPVALEVLDWKSENLTLRVPRDGAGSAGLVQVDVDGRWSNFAQLTRVTVPLHASQSCGGTLTVDIDATVTFRGDFRGRRMEPAEPVAYEPWVPCASSPLAAGRFTASGRYTYRDGDSTITIDWSGGGSFGPVSEMQSTVLMHGLLALPGREGRFMVGMSGSGIVETTTVSWPNQAPQVSTRTIGFVVSSRADGGDSLSVVVAFTTEFGAPAVTQNYTTPGLYPGANRQTQLRCGPFTAEFAPDEEWGGR